LEGSKNHNSVETWQAPNCPQILSPISLLFTTEKLFEKLILRTIQRDIQNRNLLDGSQFGFQVHRSTTLKLRLTDHVTLNFNHNNSTSAVFLNVDKAFGTT
jgi:hypothetical protein